MHNNKFRLSLGVIGVLALLFTVYFLINKKSTAENNREEMSIILNNIVVNAQTHYKRTNSFEGWTIPGSMKIDKIGTFREKIENNKVTIYAVGRELGENGLSNVNIESKITGNNTTVTIRN